MIDPTRADAVLVAAPQALPDRLEDRLGVVARTSWGMTETSTLGTVAPATAARWPSSRPGRPSIGVDLLPTDERGPPAPERRGVPRRLKVRGAGAVARHLGQDASATDADGWFDTGDLAVTDGDLGVTGRAKDLIESGGEWINPGEIEAIVGELPAVALVADDAPLDAIARPPAMPRAPTGKIGKTRLRAEHD